MLKLENTVKTFDGFRALDDLTMTVPQGAVYGLVGPNGAGKSTIIRHLAGVYRQDSGEILIDGQPVYENPSIKGRIAYIPDDIFYFLQAGIRDMMKFYRGIYPNFDMDRYEKLHEAFSLDEKRPIRRLSKGMQKQAAFWLAISMRPDVLILDEPTAGLDPAGREEILSNIMAYREAKNATIMMVSHSMSDVARITDRLLVLNGAKLAMDGTPKEVFAHAQELLEMGLDIPDLTRVFLKLQAMGLPVKPVYSMEQAVEALKALKGGNPYA